MKINYVGQNDLRMKKEENSVLCIKRMFLDVMTFTECNEVTDVKLIN